jgi:hypothetical protein
MNGRKRLLCVFTALGLWLGAAPPSAHAEPRAESAKRDKQEKRGKKKRRRPKPDASREAPKPAQASEAKAPAPATPARESAKKRAEEAARAGAQASSDGTIVKEGDTSVKVMSFEGLDIEGRLKSPQLLYFVNRVHAEFERPKLPHRSFMPELERSTQRDPFR